LMGWCLDCHRNPAPNLRPLDKIYDIDWRWEAGKDPDAEGRALAAKFDTPDARKLTDCSTCHR